MLLESWPYITVRKDRNRRIASSYKYSFRLKETNVSY